MSITHRQLLAEALEQRRVLRDALVRVAQSLWEKECGSYSRALLLRDEILAVLDKTEHEPHD